MSYSKYAITRAIIAFLGVASFVLWVGEFRLYCGKSFLGVTWLSGRRFNEPVHSHYHCQRNACLISPSMKPHDAIALSSGLVYDQWSPSSMPQSHGISRSTPGTGVAADDSWVSLRPLSVMKPRARSDQAIIDGEATRQWRCSLSRRSHGKFTAASSYAQRSAIGLFSLSVISNEVSHQSYQHSSSLIVIAGRTIASSQ